MFNISFTEDAVCPYCGYKHEDDGEMGTDGVLDCANCERKFRYTADYSVTFSTCCLTNDHAYGEWKEGHGVNGNLSARFCKVCQDCEIKDTNDESTGVGREG